MYSDFEEIPLVDRFGIKVRDYGNEYSVCGPKTSKEFSKIGDHPYIVWVPCSGYNLTSTIKFIRAKPDDIFYDLGCGDGRICIEVARRYGCKCVGIDALKHNIDRANAHAQRESFSHLLSFKWENIFEADFTDATVVFMYLFNDVVKPLIPLLNKIENLRVTSRDFHPCIGEQVTRKKYRYYKNSKKYRLQECKTPINGVEKLSVIAT